MSELAQAVQEADAMEAALAAPLFGGVRSDVDAVLGGEAPAMLKLRVELAEEMSARMIEQRDDLHEALRDARGVIRYLETQLADTRAMGQQLMAERDEARHAKGQMELRWQAAEKECAALRAQTAALAKCKPDCYDIHGNRNHKCTKEIEACQATHPGIAWCEKCR